MEEVIRTQNLEKTFGQGDSAVTALRDCSVSIQKGEHIAIVGSSGSGKSTMLHLLGGLEEPTKGKVWYGDTDLYGLDDRARSVFRRQNIGFVFQSYNLIPELTAEENIALPALLDGKKADKAYIQNIAERLDLTDRLHHLPGELSGGQQQRVAIARALSTRPRILLCDEPTGNLDSQNGTQVIELLYGLFQEMDTTLVIVTHDKSIAAQAKRVFTITDGVVTGGDTR